MRPISLAPLWEEKAAEVNCFKRYSYAISCGDATARDLTLVHYKGDDSVLLSELEDDGSTKPYLIISVWHTREALNKCSKCLSRFHILESIVFCPIL